VLPWPRNQAKPPAKDKMLLQMNLSDFRAPACRQAGMEILAKARFRIFGFAGAHIRIFSAKVRKGLRRENAETAR
jgi:hypothetical protein